MDSYLNSATTLWTKDIYQRYIARDRSARHYLVVGKVLTVVFVAVGVLLAPLTARFPSIFGYFVTIYSVFQGPLLAILVLGFFWRRANGKGAVAGLACGVTTSGTLFWLQDKVFTCPEPYLYIAWWAFLSGLVATVAVSLATRPEPPEKINGLIYRR